MAGADAAGGKVFFGCTYCTEAFPHENELQVHQKMMHPGQPYASKPAPIPDHERAKAATSAISRSMPLSEVNRHCIPQDCWVAINGKVYDLTEFADRHPGGPSIILNWAGKDASKIYNDIHKGVKIDNYLRPEALLGDLGVDEQLMSEAYWHRLREARIQELQDELTRLRAEAESAPPAPPAPRHSTVEYLMKNKKLDRKLKVQLSYLETQKRAALDAEDFPKAQEVKGQIDALLAENHIRRPTNEELGIGGIPLSEVARHNKPHDCWVAIQGAVYDFTELTLYHSEQRKAVLAWAGRDASAMWDKIPGRFPSAKWMELYMRPDAKLGAVGAEAPVDPKMREIHEIEAELHRLEGPSEEDIQAAQAARASPGVPRAAATQSEEGRFPKLAEVRGSKELPVFTRAEVAKHKGPAGGPAGTKPYMIIHNKVYDLTKLLGSHPGGDEVLLSRAGTDATKDFELFEHSEKSRLRRDQDLLVGELIAAECTDWGAEAAAAGGEALAAAEGGAMDAGRFIRFKVADTVLAFVCWYAYRSYTTWKPLSKLTYSRGLRHLHFIMAAGIFGALGSAQAASRTEGLTKKRWLAVHKQTGIAMLLALFARILVRMRSGIPPRFPGNPLVRSFETFSLQFFYAIMLAIPVSGLANEYFLKYADGDAKDNDKKAQQAITFHTKAGRFFQSAWLPFHLGYTTAYHWANGRGVVKKVSPFI